MTRSPSIRGAIKRLSAITVTEMQNCTPKDLRNIVKLQNVIAAAHAQLSKNRMPNEDTVHVQ